MKYKKLLATVMAAMMTLSVIGCGNSAPAAQTPAESAASAEGTEPKADAPAAAADGEQIQIRFSWWGDTKRNDMYNAICDRFEAENPNIKVMREPMSWTDYWPKMATQAGGGNLPDAFGMHPQFAADYAMRGTMADLGPYVEDGTLDISKMSDSVIQTGKYEDTLYMISQGVTFTSYFVNEELAKEYGVELPAYDEDWTWDDLKAKALEFAEKAKGTGIYFCNDASGGINEFRWCSRQSGGDNYTEDGQIGFEAKVMEGWLGYWKELRDAGAIPDAATNTEEGATALEQRLFASGKMLMCNNPVNQLWLFQNAMPDNTVSPIRIPTDNEGNRGEYLEGAHFGISAGVDEAHQRAAAKLINFFVNTEKSYELFLLDQGVPANSDMAEFIKPLLDEPNQKVINYVSALMETAEVVKIVPPEGASEVNDAFKVASEKVAYESDTIENAVAEFMDKANAILQK